MFSARHQCCVAEYEVVLEMGPTIRLLVIYKLLEGRNFPAVFLCKYEHLSLQADVFDFMLTYWLRSRLRR